MHKKLLLGSVAALIVAVGAFFALNSYIYNEKQGDAFAGSTQAVTGTITAVDTSQAAFDGPFLVTLRDNDGKAWTIAVPSMGLPLCAAYKNNNIGDISLLKVGDEIRVRGAVGEDGRIVPCESADHYLEPTPLVVGDFEGEADPSRMTLNMKRWEFVKAQYNDGRVLEPARRGVFSLTFGNQGALAIGTDCNSAGGTYTLGSNNQLTIREIYMTKMFCQASQEADFIKLLENTSSYHFTAKGELILALKFDSGTVTFR